MGNHQGGGRNGHLFKADICPPPVGFIWHPWVLKRIFPATSIKKVVHVLPDDEIKDLFRIIDEYRPAIQVPFFYRLSMEYRVIFRLIYCCGLRISEARTPKQEDVDLKNGRVRILEVKGHKDRFVYLADDLAELLQGYMAAMKTYTIASQTGFFRQGIPKNTLPMGRLINGSEKAGGPDTLCKRLRQGSDSPLSPAQF